MEAALNVKLIYTAVVYFLFLQLALRFGIVGPSLLDLKENFGVSYNKMSYSVSIMCVGICTGAISSGYISKLMCMELLACILMVLSSLMVATITYLSSFTLFLCWNFLLGFTSGAGISISESWILQIWGKQCGPYMQALQFFRGLGYIIAPVLIEPFVNQEETENTVNGEGNNVLIQNNTLNEHINYNPEIHIPYLLNSSMLGLGAILTLGLYIYKLIEKKRLMKKTISRLKIMCETSISTKPKNDDKLMITTKGGLKEVTIDERRVKYYGYTVVVLCSILYFFIYEEMIITYLPSFATKIKLKLSKSESNMLTTAFNISNIVGKAISIFLTLKFSHVTMIYMNLTIMLGSMIMMIVFGDTNKLMLWVGTCLHGIGISSIVASMYTLMEKTIKMTPLICGILNMSGTSGSVVLPLIVGPFMEEFPMVLLYSILACIIFSMLTFMMITCLLKYQNLIITKPVKKIESTSSNTCNTIKVPSPSTS